MNPTGNLPLIDNDLYEIVNREPFFNMIYHHINAEVASGRLRVGNKIKLRFDQAQFKASKKHRHCEKACVEELSKEFDAYMRQRVPWYRRHYRYLTWHWVREGDTYSLMLRFHIFPLRPNPRKTTR